MAGHATNNHQWPQTENANKGFLHLLMKSNEEELEEIFLKTPTFAAEKLDGTNIAKDNTGQVYFRRLVLGAADSHFQVRAADIEMFRQNLCLTLGLEEERMERCLVHGELQCNSYYDYRDLSCSEAKRQGGYSTSFNEGGFFLRASSREFNSDCLKWL